MNIRIILVILLFASACKSKSQDSFVVSGLPPVPENNPLTENRSELGKLLFFDPRLSGSNWISCATCHNPSLGWSDKLPKAIGHGMLVLGRNTPTIINTGWNAVQFWDGRADSLEAQAKGPITAPGEMNQNMEELVGELNSIEGYRVLFEKAYPGEGVTENSILKAIASYERTIVSRNSPFDKWRLGDESSISDEAKNGFNLFVGKAACAVCHQGANFTDNGFHNIGIKELSGQQEDGRFSIVPLNIMKGAFKTPTLRDVALSGPYMHNGMYQTLEDVVEHYVRGGDSKENLSPNMSAVSLSNQEKKEIVEFMKSLTGEQVKVEVPRLPQ